MWFPLPPGRRHGVLAFGAAGVLATLAGAVSSVLMPSDWSGVLRDWLPAPILPCAYWQAGRFYSAPNQRLQDRLERIDAYFAVWLSRLDRAAEAPLAVRYLEATYLLAYPLVPLGLGALYLAGLGALADTFWTVVLPAAYVCYGMVPLAPLLPPRLSDGGSGGLDRWARAPRRAGDGRRLNLWFLDRFGIVANTFPSGHVAATTAASLVVAQHLPSVGGVFLFLSGSIAVSVVVRRYHYLADAVLALALAFVVWWVVAG